MVGNFLSQFFHFGLFLMCSPTLLLPVPVFPETHSYYSYYHMFIGITVCIKKGEKKWCVMFLSRPVHYPFKLGKFTLGCLRLGLGQCVLIHWAVRTHCWQCCVSWPKSGTTAWEKLKGLQLTETYILFICLSLFCVHLKHNNKSYVQ